MNWEPWAGCYKESDGCDNCYFYGPHAKLAIFMVHTLNALDKTP